MKERWIYEQFSTIDVGDARLQKRAVDVAIGCAQRPEESLAGRWEHTLLITESGYESRCERERRYSCT